MKLPTSWRRLRTHRPAFTESEFERHFRFFWSMPSAWGTAETPILRELRRTGGTGSLSILPVLGRYAHWKKAGQFALSLEECSRLAGCDVGSIKRGIHALKAQGLAATELGYRHGQQVTIWNVTKGMAAALTAGRLDSHSFRFESRVIYGGAWSMLTGAQRAVYLAVATQAFTYALDDALALLHSAVIGDAAMKDVDETIRVEGVSGSSSVRLRIAEASVGQVSRILGMSQSAVHEAINGLKNPRIWPGSRATEAQARHSPLVVYPTAPGRSNVFVFRDDAPRWPFDALNARFE